MKKLLTFLILLSTIGCVHAQQVKLGGTDGAGGTSGVHNPGQPRLVITTNSLAGATANTAYSQTINSNNGTAPLTWTIAFGSLPTGLTLNSSTGTISGTPTVVGNFNFTVLVTDSSTSTAQTATKDLTIAVSCGATLQIISQSPLPLAIVGSTENFQFISTGGLGLVTWTAGAGLPTGTSLSSGGLLSGSPTTAGLYSFNITATDSCPTPQVVSVPFTQQVNNSLTITTGATLPNGTRGSPYSTQFSASGGTSPYTWSSTGTLPTGTNLSSAGVLSGTPTQAGTFTFTVTVTDSLSATNSSQFTVTINCGAALTISSPATLPTGTQGVAYSYQLQFSGGNGSVTWAKTGGTIDSGLSISSGGLISGTPTSPATYAPVITATDSCTPTAQTASQTFSLIIGQGLVISTNTVPNAVQGTPYTTTIVAQGGTPPYQWTVPSGPFATGAIDILDYMLMPLPDRNSNRMQGGLAPKYGHLDGGLLWQIKGASGNPWDINLYDDTSVYLWFTENNDADQQAACQAAGYASCFVDPFSYKQAISPRPFAPRYFVPGSIVTYMQPPTLTSGSVNPGIRTTNCGVDNQPLRYLGNVKTVTSGPSPPPSFAPINGNWGGSIGVQNAIETDYYYSGNVSGVYDQRERFWFVKGFGWIFWDHGNWNGISYTIDMSSLNNTKAVATVPTPNFGCGIPNLPLTGILPTGVTVTNSPSLNLIDSTGAIVGTPNTSGTSSFTVQVEDSVGTITQKQFNMTVTCGQTLSITSTSSLPQGTINQAYSSQLLKTGGVASFTWQVIGGAMPQGLSLSTSGLLSGTPTQTGTFNFTIQVLDGCKPNPQSDQQQFTLAIAANNGPLAITTTSLNAGTEGQAYSQQLQASGGTTPYTWSLTGGSLPAGLTLTSAGVISGTPTTAGNSSFTVRVTDTFSASVTKALNINITCPTLLPTSTSPLPAGTASQAYNFQFTSSGGISPYSYSLVSGTLPTGLSLSGAGALTGTPSVAGISTFTVRTTDSCVATAQSTQASFSLTINPAPVPLSVTTTSLPAATEGVPYSAQLNATGGTTPYTWSLASGSLPTGLTLSSSGAITGMPTSAGTASFTAKVADAVAATANQALQIIVSCPSFSITSPNQITTAVQGQTYSFQFTSTGGITPITWSFASGSAPAGLSLSSTGLLSGTPSTSGTFTLNIKATDSCVPTPQAPTKQFTLQIIPALTISTTSPLPSATEGQAYSTQLSAVGGTPGYTWAVSAGVLPVGLTLNTSTGVISGTPTSTTPASFTIRVTDSASQTTTKAFTLPVTCPALSNSSNSPLPPGTVGQPYSFQFTSSGGVGAISWSATGVPSGLSLSASGLLSGTPVSAATSSINVTVTDSCNPTPQSVGPTAFSLTINAAIPPVLITSSTPLPQATEGVAYNNSLAATGGVPPYTWSITAGGPLQTGLSLSAGGVISGTPTSASTVTPTFHVVDSAAGSDSKVLSLTVACPAFTVTSTSPLPPATQNQAYSFTFTKTGGAGSVAWTATGVPTGLSLNSSTGVLSGTPTGTGTSTINVTATDSCSPTPQVIGPTGYSLTINAAPNPLSINTSSPLPSAIQNQFYSTTVTATGGTPPYGSWTVTVGTLPTGLTLHSTTGVIDGTPTGTGSSTFTIRVTDNVAATATKSFTLTVNAATAADNRYCNVNETTNFTSPTDGPATLPTNCVRTAMSDTPASGPTKTVCASGCDFTTITAASTAASAGWIIQIKAVTGSAQNVFSSATISTSGTSTNWIIYESDQIANCPAEGTRVSPAWVGVPSMAGYPNYNQPATSGIYMPKIRGGNNTITISPNVHHVRFVCLEITTNSGTNTTNTVLQNGPNNHIIWDRIYNHGGDSQTGRSITDNARGWFWSGCTYCAIIDSYINDYHCKNGGSCTDAQGVLLGGNSASTEGPFKTTNLFISAASEPIFAGGGGTGATSTVPHDLEARRFHSFHPLFWKANDPSYFGTSFSVKNLFELKNLDRVLIEGAILENTWEGQADQHGHAALFGAKNQASAFGGTASSNGAGTITKLTGGINFNSNQVSPNCAVALHCNFKYNGLVYKVATFVDATHITLQPNSALNPPLPAINASAAFQACQPGQNPNAQVTNVTFRLSYVSHAKNAFQIFAGLSDCGDKAAGTGNISLHDIVTDDIDGATWVSAPGARSGNESLGLGQISNNVAAPNNLHDVTVRHVTGLGRLSSGTTAGTFGPGVMFTDQTQPTTSISNLKIYDSIFAASLQLDQLGICPYTNRFVDATRALNCVGAVGGSGPATYCFDHNLLATSTATSGATTTVPSNPPYPNASPNCPFATTGNQLPASYNAIQFTNLNGAIGGNYQLLNTSPYFHTASDGTDPGVNWTLQQQAIAGVN